MTTAMIIALLVVWIAAIASPGPDLLQIIRHGSKNRSDGIWTAIGIMVGNSLWIVASLLGLSALISTTPAILTMLQFIGGGYLVWMGAIAVRSWRRQRGQHVVVASSGVTTEDSAAAIGKIASLRSGIATNLSNPKAVLFFGSVFAQFIRPDVGVETSIFIAVFLIVTGLLWFVGFAFLVRTFAVRIARSSALIDLCAGVIFIALGLFMVWQGLVGSASQFLN